MICVLMVKDDTGREKFWHAEPVNEFRHARLGAKEFSTHYEAHEARKHLDSDQDVLIRVEAGNARRQQSAED